MNCFLLSLALVSGDQLSGLDYRVSQLESRMDAVEAKLGIKTTAVVAPQAAQPVVIHYQQPVFFSEEGDCTNGQCGNSSGGGFFRAVGRGFFGRRK